MSHHTYSAPYCSLYINHWPLKIPHRSIVIHLLRYDIIVGFCGDKDIAPSISSCRQQTVNGARDRSWTLLICYTLLDGRCLFTSGIVRCILDLRKRGGLLWQMPECQWSTREDWLGCELNRYNERKAILMADCHRSTTSTNLFIPLL